MSGPLQTGRVGPSDADNVSAVSVISSVSMTELQFNAAFHDHSIEEQPQNMFEKFFKGSPKSFYGKTKQFFKILFIIMIPLMLLTGLTTNTFCRTFTNYHEFSKIRSTLLYSVKLGRVIHYLQEERDVSALYLIASRKEVKRLLLKSYTETDRSLEDLTSWTASPTMTRREFNSKEKFLSFLNKHRYELDTLKQTVVQELQMYTSLIRVFITWLYDAVTEDQSGSIWRSLVAYQEVVAAKEHKGLERALGTIYYAAGQFSSIDVYLWFLESQDVANATFFSAMQYSELVLDLYKTFNDEELRYGIFAHMSADIKRNYSVGDGTLQTAQWWFENKTVFMDLLLETQSELAVDITQMLDALQQINVNQIWMTSVVFLCVFIITVIIVYVVYSLNDEIQKYMWTLSIRSTAVKKEIQRTDLMLYSMVPKVVADILKVNESMGTQTYTSVTILLSDIQGFTKVHFYSYPEKVIYMLNAIYHCFDSVVAKYDVYRVESIGDVFMVVSGAPEPQVNHATDICSMALELTAANNELELLALPSNQLKIRTGIHTGPVVASVIGSVIKRYLIFGETVTLAAEMESLGKPSKIHVSEPTYDIVSHAEEFVLKERIDRQVMHQLDTAESLRGRTRTFWLTGPSSDALSNDSSNCGPLSSDDNEAVTTME